jgi:16S rRNA processing protein RimM
VSANAGKLVIVGRVSGPHGIKGWLKIQSFTEPKDNLLGYPEWVLRGREHEHAAVVEQASARGNAVLVKLHGIDDRDAALAWVGAQIAVPRSRLPACAPGEYYWTDLEGLQVRTPAGEVLGTVDHLLATGSNDVLVLDGERRLLIPFIQGSVIRSVDLDARVIVAEWFAQD